MKVYYFDFSGFPKEPDELYPLLSEDRKKYCMNFGSKEAALRSIWAYILLRYALIKSCGISEKPALTIGEHGKPSLTGCPGIYFSLSHTGQRVICAVSDTDVGADIQDIRNISDNAARKFCTPGELEEINRLADSQQRYELLSRLWCVKESAGKLSGLGFSEGFAGISVSELENCGRAAVILRDGCFISVCSHREIEGVKLCELQGEELLAVVDRKSCVIFGGGEEYPGFFREPEGKCFKVAADAGLLGMISYKVVADRIIGDFDSLGKIPAGEKVTVLPKEKDRTDMHEAVLLGLAEGCDEFHIYFGTGGRLDHTLANIQLGAGLALKGKRCVIYGDGYCIAFVSPGLPLYLKPDRGYVSVFSVTDKCTGVIIKGLKYSLEGSEITNTYALGVSNEYLPGRGGFISVSGGILAVYYSIYGHDYNN